MALKPFLFLECILKDGVCKMHPSGIQNASPEIIYKEKENCSFFQSCIEHLNAKPETPSTKMLKRTVI